MINLLFALALTQTDPPQMSPMTLPAEAGGTTQSILPRGRGKSPFPIPEANRNTPPPEAQPQPKDKP